MAETGKAVKDVRKLRGLTQRELAEMSGVSLSLIRKLERGERDTARMETLRSLAKALRVPTMRLAGEGEPEGPVSGAVDRWTGVRRALERPPTINALDEPPTVDGVRSVMAAALPLFKGDRLAQLAVILPRMLRDADTLGVDGRELRARLLQLSGWLMVQTRQFDAARSALTRAMDEAPTQLDRASTAMIVCWLLLRQGKLDQALDLAVHWADEVEPRMSRATPDELATWGWLLLRASAAAVRNGQDGQASDTLKLARSAAVAIGKEYTPGEDFLRTFGPTTVKLKSAENAAIGGYPDAVLRIASTVPLVAMRPTSNNRNRHLLDVADAHTKLGQYSEAFDKLIGIRGASPEWLPNQAYGRTILGRIIEGRRTLTSDMRSLAAEIHLTL
ncbi:helix-turn-helix domain-containing protein [Streptomyces fuscigenes]|uniref:helix-turn-helix domain-containing protein n=1 Tax=Streptomyces fuscigenes TaxID=1528880 RepID=UPI001F435A06|nr:helix-turn-helix domain-containing protein [Streptomyces fuscigenes]MCF3963942.1 helix-turn-helix domain-containing protein [Streptomyces fuscigenes]